MIASSRVTSQRLVRSRPRRRPNSTRSKSLSARRPPTGSALSTIWPWLCNRSTTAPRSGASTIPRANSPVPLTADQRNDGITRSNLAGDASRDLLDRGVALDHGQQSGIDNGTHSVGDRGLFDVAVIAAFEDQPVNRWARQQQLGNSAAAAITGAAAFRAADRTIKRKIRDIRRQPFEAKALDQGRRRLLGLFASRA